LAVNTRYYTSGFAGTGRGRRAGAVKSAKFLNVFGEVEDGVTPWRPLGHLKLKRFIGQCRRQFYFNCDFEKMRSWTRHRQMVGDRFERRLLRRKLATDKKSKE
jgi:hypothetical protein